MKYLLIAMVFNLQPITYSDKATCEEARDLVRKNQVWMEPVISMEV